MVPTIREKILLACMRERKVAEIVAESCRSQYPPPIYQCIRLAKLGNTGPNVIGYVITIRHNVEHATCKFHDPKRVFESLVCRSWVHEVGQGELMNMTEPLKRA